MSGSGSAGSVPTRNDANDRHRTGSGDRSVGAESEHQRPWPDIDGEDGPRAREVKSVGLLIGRQKGAVDQNAAVDEVQPPPPCAFIDAGDRRSRLGFLLAGGG